MARYSVNNYTVETLLSDIKSGNIAIPEWQRSIKKYCENTNLCQVNGKYETSM